MVKQADSASYRPACVPAEPVAIVGMAGRFPGASTVDDFRRNLMERVESITFFDEAELRAAGQSEEDLADREFVGAAPVLGGTDLFDAGLFGLNAREAQLLDPQFRVFVEVCHEALQDGGVVPGRHDVRVGVYAGSKHNAYMDRVVQRNSEVMGATGHLMVIINNHTDYLATRVAYRLGLTGPAVTMQTACSTSLVAVHSAVQALLAGECDVALAGGVAIAVPEVAGYLYREGGILSPDGHSVRSTPRRAAPCSAAASAWWCSSGWRTRSPTATTSTRSSGARAVNNDGAPRSASPRRASTDRRGHRGGAGDAGRRPGDHRLRRGARHRHAPRRSDRDRGADRGVPRGTPTRSGTARSASSRRTSATSTRRPASPA